MLNKKERSNYLCRYGFSYANRVIKKYHDYMNSDVTDAILLKTNELAVLRDPVELAQFLDIELSLLIKLASIKKKITFEESRYRNCKIEKKSGGYRRIRKPKKEMMNIQKKIHEFILLNIEPNACATGFRLNSSIIVNARWHLYTNIKYVLDLKDFFNGINFDKILNAFLDLGYSGAISFLLAILCAYIPRKLLRKRYLVLGKSFGFLPQGAPTSPAISNLVCKEFDENLNKIAGRFDFKYTRYGDDLGFSSRTRFRVPWNLRNKIIRCIHKYGFLVNFKKERWGRRIELTGIVIHPFCLSINRDWIHRMRAALHKLSFMDEDDVKTLSLFVNVQGRVAHAFAVNKNKYRKFYDKFISLKNGKFKNIFEKIELENEYVPGNPFGFRGEPPPLEIHSRLALEQSTPSQSTTSNEHHFKDLGAENRETDIINQRQHENTIVEIIKSQGKYSFFSFFFNYLKFNKKKLKEKTTINTTKFKKKKLLMEMCKK